MIWKAGFTSPWKAEWDLNDSQEEKSSTLKDPGEIAQELCFGSLMNWAFVALEKESSLWGCQWLLNEDQKGWRIADRALAPVGCDFNEVELLDLVVIQRRWVTNRRCVMQALGNRRPDEGKRNPQVVCAKRPQDRAMSQARNNQKFEQLRRLWEKTWKMKLNGNLMILNF